MANLFVFLVLFLISPGLVLSDSSFWTLRQIHRDGRYRQKVLVEGELARKLTFDTFVIKDETGSIFLNMENVKQSLEEGDRVVVYGRYGDTDQSVVYEEEIFVYDYAKADDAQKIAELIDTYKKRTGKKKKSWFGSSKKEDIPVIVDDTEETSSAPTPTRTIESRLQELDGLKQKGLIQPDEYDTLRKKILDEI